MAFLMPNAHSVCALEVSRVNGDHSLRNRRRLQPSGEGRGDGTYVFLAKSEVVLHGLLRTLVDRFALRFLC
jgi:hypothetical protein